MNKKRNSNIELLRIIAMILIVLNHLSYHGGGFSQSLGFNHYLNSILICGGKFGVAIFVIIGSFFMIKKSPSVNSIISLWIKTFFVSLFFGVIEIITSGFSIVSFIKSCLPFFTATLWFVTEYIILMILSPFLNVLINKLSKCQYALLMVILLIVCSIIPTLKLGGDIFLNEFVWFIFLYLLVGFLSLHTKITKMGNKKYYLIFISLVAYIAICAIICCFGEDYLFIRSSGSFLILVSSICLFFFAVNFEERNNSVINFVAKSTFLVYLLHDNSMRDYIWHNVFKTQLWYDSSYYMLFALIIICALFSLAILINMLLDYIIKKILNISFIHNFCDKTNSFISEIGNV